MSDREINQLIIATIINASIVAWLIYSAWQGNDKAIILVIFFYPLIVLLNGILWLGTKSRAFKITTIGLMILFLPALLIAAMH